jgi:arylsulfate sulfotransferase
MTLQEPSRATLPPIRITRCDADRREPGSMLFNVRSDTKSGSGPRHCGWLLGVDRGGSITCIHESEAPVHGVRRLPNGHVLVTIVDGLLLEMTLTGAIVRRWYATGRYRDRAPPKDGIPVEAETFHHGVNLGPDGSMLLLSMEIREFDDWPGSVTDPNAPRARAKVVGDVVMEVRPDGSKANEWHILDLLDPRRVTYGSRANYWGARGYPGTMDWCHANGTFYDAKDDCILVSLRTQDCIIKFERKTGRLRWILGAPDRWRKPWSDKLLKPDSSVTWQFHQHDCSITESGTILCFDNGNNRALPFAPRMTAAASYSRAVEFAIDEANGTIRQVWSYGEAPDQRLFAGFQGGAVRLPKTGNTFITYGGVCSIGGRPATGPDRFEVGEAYGNINICARLVEVTPSRDVVFDAIIGSEPNDPSALSAFRSEHLPTEIVPALLL